MHFRAPDTSLFAFQRQCAKRRHRSSVDKTENVLFVCEHSENWFLAVFTNTKKTKNTTKKDQTLAILSIFAHLPVNIPISGVHGGKCPGTRQKNGGWFREHKFHWGGQSSRPTDRPTRVCALSRRWCEYHRPVVLFVRFGSVAQPQAKQRGRFAHCSEARHSLRFTGLRFVRDLLMMVHLRGTSATSGLEITAELIVIDRITNGRCGTVSGVWLVVFRYRYLSGRSVLCAGLRLFPRSVSQHCSRAGLRP